MSCQIPVCIVSNNFDEDSTFQPLSMFYVPQLTESIVTTSSNFNSFLFRRPCMCNVSNNVCHYVILAVSDVREAVRLPWQQKHFCTIKPLEHWKNIAKTCLPRMRRKTFLHVCGVFWSSWLFWKNWQRRALSAARVIWKTNCTNQNKLTMADQKTFEQRQNSNINISGSRRLLRYLGFLIY